MSDLISRQAAIDLVRDVCDAILSQCGSHYDGDDEVYDDLLEVDAVLKCNKEIRISLANMPSVQEQRWIPCAEKYPDMDERVLVCIDSYDYHVWDCMSNRGEDYFWEDEDGLFHNKYEVTAWMPLPEPYTEMEGAEDDKG